MDPDENVPASVAAAGPAFRNAYVMLRRQYAANLPQRLRESREALAACLREPQDPAALALLRRLMHTMAGTAPTLGFEAHGRHAREIEHLVQALAAQPGRCAADFAPVDAGLVVLESLP